MRVALLPLPGNPFVLDYWLRNFEQVWADEVDALHIFVNGHRNPDVKAANWRMVEECSRRVRPTVTYREQEMRLVHGDVAQKLFEHCTTVTDSVVFVEHDAFVRFPGAMEDAFSWVESTGGVVGSPRGGMSPEVEKAARKKWGSDPEGPDGSSGYGLWPCFLFGLQHVLAPVLAGFPSQSWQRGQTIPGLGYVCPAEMTTDTFTLAAFMLRATGRPLHYEGQWKELWLKVLPEMQARAGYDPRWFHSGGLSNEDYYNGGGAMNARPDIGGSLEGVDWAHRIWWLRRCVEHAPRDLLPELRHHYDVSLQALAAFCGVEEDVQAWDEKLPPWITWDG